MKNKRQNLNISISIIEKAINDKRALNALAFAVCIKRRYVSSSIKNPTLYKIRKEFGMNLNKAKQVVADGLEYGYIKNVNGCLVALPLYDKIDLVYKLDLPEENKVYKTSKELRKITLFKKLSTQKFIKDKFTHANNPAVGTSKKKITSAKKQAKNFMCNDEQLSGLLSYDKIAKMMGVCRKTAFNYTKECVKENQVNKKSERLRIHKDDLYTEKNLKKINSLGINHHFFYGDFMYFQLPCSFDINDNIKDNIKHTIKYHKNRINLPSTNHKPSSISMSKI